MGLFGFTIYIRGFHIAQGRLAKNDRRFDNGEIDFLLGDVAISDVSSPGQEMEDEGTCNMVPLIAPCR